MLLINNTVCVGQDPKLGSVQDINAITGALKSFLRSLPTPLIHGGCYTDLLEQVKSSKATQCCIADSFKLN